MVQTLHILRKDIRRFRYELCVVAALTGAFAWADIAADVPGQPQFSRAAILAGFGGFFLVLAWWFLVSQLIHEESLAGDRQPVTPRGSIAQPDTTRPRPEKKRQSRGGSRHAGTET